MGPETTGRRIRILLIRAASRERFREDLESPIPGRLEKVSILCLREKGHGQAVLTILWDREEQNQNLQALVPDIPSSPEEAIHRGHGQDKMNLIPEAALLREPGRPAAAQPREEPHRRAAVSIREEPHRPAARLREEPCLRMEPELPRNPQPIPVVRESARDLEVPAVSLVLLHSQRKAAPCLKRTIIGGLAYKEKRSLRTLPCRLLCFTYLL